MFVVQMSKNLIDYHRIFDAGDDLDVAAAGLAGLNVDICPVLIQREKFRVVWKC